MTPQRCVSCGAELVHEARFCHRCGRASATVEVIDVATDDWRPGRIAGNPVTPEASDPTERSGPPRWIVAAGVLVVVALLGWLAASGGDDDAFAAPTPGLTEGPVISTPQSSPTSAPAPTATSRPIDDGMAQASLAVAWKWAEHRPLEGVRPTGVSSGPDGLRLFGWIEGPQDEAGLHVWSAAEAGAGWTPDRDGPVLRSEAPVTEVVATPSGYLAVARSASWLAGLWRSLDGLDWEPVEIPAEPLLNPVVNIVAGRIVVAGIDQGLGRLPPDIAQFVVAHRGSLLFDEDRLDVWMSPGVVVATRSLAELGLEESPPVVFRTAIWSRPVPGGEWERDTEIECCIDVGGLDRNGQLVLMSGARSWITSDGREWSRGGADALAAHVGWAEEPVWFERIWGETERVFLHGAGGEPIRLDPLVPGGALLREVVVAGDVAALGVAVWGPPTRAHAAVVVDGGRIVWDSFTGLVAITDTGEEWIPTDAGTATADLATGQVTLTSPAGDAALTVPAASLAALGDLAFAPNIVERQVLLSVDGIRWSPRSIDDAATRGTPGESEQPMRVAAVGETAIIAYETADGATRTLIGTPVELG